MLIFITVSLMIIHLTKNQAIEVKIGGLFYENGELNTSLEEKVFRAAIEKYSREQEITALSAVEYASRDDFISIQSKVCRLLEKPVIAIFGTLSQGASILVKSISDTKEIPLIQTKYDSKLFRGSCGINLFPHPATLFKVYTDIIQLWNWKNFGVIYENNESLIRISDLLQSENVGNATVQIYQLPQDSNYRHLFHKIRTSKDRIYNFLIDCSIELLPEVLKQAQQTGLMVENYNYIITCLDLHTLDLEQYKYSGVNITGIRLIDPSSISSVSEYFSLSSPETEPVEVLLIYDAVNLLMKTLNQLNKLINNTSIFDNELDLMDRLNCANEYSSKFGYSIVNAMKTNEINGITGLIKFDHEGFRTDVQLQIIELTKYGIQEKGMWNISKGIMIKNWAERHGIESADVLSNTTFKVIISLTKPYGMIKRSSSVLTGNDRYEGYAVDLIHELSLLSNFKYELIIQEDKNVGQYINKTKWDGMIGKILSEEADLAIADSTESTERSQFVQFSEPFMNLGIAILFVKPKKEPPDYFSFLSPFSYAVWLLVVTAYIGVSLQFFIMARISPFEWRNPYPCVEEPEELENQFTLSNSFWFTIGALMQQGTDIAPASPSTRIAAGLWWFFTLIMVSSYTANLAACLTVENESSPFKDAKDLANQDKIKYGAKKKGTTYNFFHDSKIPEFQRIYSFMHTHPDFMTNDNEEGVKKVLNSNKEYAFFMESSAIDYEKEQNCDLAQIGPLLDNKNYGIIMRKNVWYADTIGKDVLVLQEKGILGSLKRKWWKEKYSKNCQESNKNDAETISLDHVEGVFSVLIVGVVIAFIIMLFEVYFKIKNTTNMEQEGTVSMKHKFHNELKFVLKCKSVKPVKKLDEKNLLGSQSENINLTCGNDSYGSNDDNSNKDTQTTI